MPTRPRAGSRTTRGSLAWTRPRSRWAGPARAVTLPRWSVSSPSSVGARDSSSSSSSIPSPTPPSTRRRPAPSPRTTIRSRAPTWNGSGVTISVTMPIAAIPTPRLSSRRAWPAFPPPWSSRPRSTRSATRENAMRTPSSAQASAPPAPAMEASPTASWGWKLCSTRDAPRWRKPPRPFARLSPAPSAPSPCPLPLRGRGGGGRGVYGAESPQLHLARGKPSRLADVGAGGEVDGDAPTMPGLGVARGQRGGEAQRVAREPLEAVGIAHDHVRAGFRGHVQPRVAGFAEPEGEQVIVRRGAANQHGQAVRGDEAARHRAALPYPLLGIGRRRRGAGGHAG